MFPQSPLAVTVELQLAGVWTDITDFVYLRDPLKITWGRQDWGARVTPGRCPMQINNRGGQFSIRNPHGPYYGILTRNTPVRIYVTIDLPGGGTLVSYRFTGEIRAWPNRWDLSGNDRWVAVEAVGLLRRYEQGAKPLYDSLRRHIEAAGPLAYWPLTDGETARHGSEVIRGAMPMRAVGETGTFYQGQPNWGRGTLATWLDAVVELPAETVGRLAAPLTHHTTPAWAVDHVFAGGGPAGVGSFGIYDTGPRSNANPQIEWLLEFNAVLNFVQVYVISLGEDTSTDTLLATINNPGIFDQAAHHIRMATTASGANTTWTLSIDGKSVSSGTALAVAHRPVARIVYAWGLVGGTSLQAAPRALGHLTYWGASQPTPQDTYRAMLGHNREPAGRRIERLCAEQQVPLQVTGSLDDTPQMGPQRPATFLDVLRAAEEVDGGVLGEARDSLALAYRTRASKYNQGV